MEILRRRHADARGQHPADATKGSAGAYI